jgi:energy-coupling factor transporter ATP-binding protein EcfA2
MNNDGSRDAIEELAAELSAQFGIVRCASVGELLKRSTDRACRLVAGKCVRIAGYYELAPAMMIYDARLGTLGLVETVSRADDESQWQRKIEQAAAARQIFIEEAESESRRKERKLALQVEIVLLVSGEAPKGADPLRTVLTKIARETGYLRLIGLSVLEIDKHPQFTAGVLRRAFPWLLKDTESWFEKKARPANGITWKKAEQGFTLEMCDYRIAGRRKFAFRAATEAWLNLVHGHNGSGKSALAEALELLVTDRIQRLDDGGEKNYFRAVRYRPSNEGLPETPAEARIATDALLAKAVIQDNQPVIREGKEPNTSLPANSFRIDQLFMDKLIRSNAGERAALFLDAFSPGERSNFTRLQESRASLRLAWDALPEHAKAKAQSESDASSPRTTLSDEQIAEYVENVFGGVFPASESGAAQSSEATETQPEELSPTILEALLPCDRSDLQLLAQLNPRLRDKVDAFFGTTNMAAVSDALSQLQSALSMLFSALPSHIADLRTAQRIFQEFGKWKASGIIEKGVTFEADLTGWLELQALLDLSTKWGEVANTISAARQNGWEPDPSDEVALSITTAPVSWDERLGNLREQLNGARARLEAWREAEAEGAGERAQSGARQFRRWLSPVEVEALNRVGRVLTSTEGKEALGVRFNRALAQNRRENMAKGVIGKPGGLEDALKEATAMLGACERLQANSSANMGGAGQLEAIRKLVSAVRYFKEVTEHVSKSFFLELAGSDAKVREYLSAAFNELLALTTPARWVYRDIELSPEIDGGQPAMGLQTREGARAELLFNTAELNASALVLFLLLAPRLANPLQLLILDDPLQNMDELTVITLARAFAKLRFVFPAGWQMLALFHGEESVERIREEASCLVYHLPWLQSATRGDDDEPISPLDAQSTLAAEWQTVCETLIADVERAPVLT